MNYSKDDVLKMLQDLREELSRLAFYYKNDSLPPSVVLARDVHVAIKRREQQVAPHDAQPADSTPNVIYVTGASARRVLHHRNQQKGGRYELYKVEGGWALWNASFKCWEAKR